MHGSFATLAVMALVLPLALVPKEGAQAAGPTITVEGTVVTVAGTPGDDTIEASCITGKVAINGVTTALGCSALTLLVIRGGQGRDSLDAGQVAAASFANLTKTRLVGGAGEDALVGSQLEDLLLGGADRDYLEGRRGNDTINGGRGRDKLYEQGVAKGILVNGSLTIGSYEDTLRSVERVTLIGTSASDLLDASGFSGGVFLGGAEGADAMLGGSGNDDLNGGPGPDAMSGFGGDDWLDGGPDNDTMNGGNGRDTLDAQGSSFTLTPTSCTGQGSDTLANFERAHLVAGTGDTLDAAAWPYPTTMSGQSGDELFIGGSSSDVIRPGEGDDTIFGNGGIDTVELGLVQDLVVTDTQAVGVGWGTDVMSSIERIDVLGTPEADTIDAHLFSGRAIINGISGPDDLIGGKGADRLYGSDGRDELRGGPGNDLLDGGPGRDRCSGGPGKDRLRNCER